VPRGRRTFGTGATWAQIGKPQHPILAIDREDRSTTGGIDRPLLSEGKGHTFESCRVRQFFLILQRDMRTRTETPTLPRSSE